MTVDHWPQGYDCSSIEESATTASEDRADYPTAVRDTLYDRIARIEADLSKLIKHFALEGK